MVRPQTWNSSSSTSTTAAAAYRARGHRPGPAAAEQAPGPGSPRPAHWSASPLLTHRGPIRARRTGSRVGAGVGGRRPGQPRLPRPRPPGRCRRGARRAPPRRRGRDGLRRCPPVPRRPPPPRPPPPWTPPRPPPVCRCAPAAPGGRVGCPGRGRPAGPGGRTAPTGSRRRDRPATLPVDPAPVDPLLPGPAGRLVVLLGLGRPEREVPDAGPLDAAARCRSAGAGGGVVGGWWGAAGAFPGADHGPAALPAAGRPGRSAGSPRARCAGRRGPRRGRRGPRTVRPRRRRPGCRRCPGRCWCRGSPGRA